jgi:hypothetical protein
MKKTIITAAASALALLAGTVAVAQTDVRPGRPPVADQTRADLVAKLDARFAKMDANRDGSITAAERTAAHEARRGERFAKLDKDGNGTLSRAEFEAPREGRKMHGGRHGGGMRHHGGRGGPGNRGGFDADANGTITKAEFQRKALERFDRADTDRNGTVTVAERAAARAAHKPRG